MKDPHKKPKPSKVDELTEALKRERADAENLRRRFEQQLSSVRSAVKADVVEQLLPIVDHFELAIKHTPDELKHNPYVTGVESIVKQFEKTLSEIGVQRIKTVGEAFDPHLHEAVAMEEGQGKNEVVSEELRAGYTLGETVLRPAMVKVKTQ